MKFIVLFLFCFLANSYSANSVKNYLQNDVEESILESKNKSHPFTYFELTTDVFFDRVSSQSSLYPNSSLLIDLNFNQYFAIHTKFGLQKIKGTTYTPTDLKSREILSGERLLYGNSLTAKELSILLNFNRTEFYVGKITPSFGAGSERESDFFLDRWYGISGTFLNQGYALTEKLGILMNVSAIETETLKVNLQASLFANDSSDLYEKPFFKERDLKDRSAGSNRSIKSHSVSTQGFIALSSSDVISFNVGYKNQFSRFDDVDEKGFSTALQYTKVLLNDLTISLFGEYTQIWDAYAIKDFSEKYNTLGVSSSFAGVTIGIVKNFYKSKKDDETEKITLTEYFIGFQVPKTELSIFLSKKQYKLPTTDASGFGINVKYKIK